MSDGTVLFDTVQIWLILFGLTRVAVVSSHIPPAVTVVFVMSGSTLVLVVQLCVGTSLMLSPVPVTR